MTYVFHQVEYRACQLTVVLQHIISRAREWRSSWIDMVLHMDFLWLRSSCCLISRNVLNGTVRIQLPSSPNRTR
jgi:hypothetical protein